MLANEHVIIKCNTLDLKQRYIYCFRNLCDTKSMGKLNSEQFALAIHLVQQKLKGIEPPPQLTPEMIPPSMRPKPAAADPTAFGVAVSDHFASL